MKPLLLDQNLSPRLIDRLADVFPNSVHVQSVGLGTAFDDQVWNYARQNDLVIVTKDADLRIGCASEFSSESGLDSAR